MTPRRGCRYCERVIRASGPGTARSRQGHHARSTKTHALMAEAGLQTAAERRTTLATRMLMRATAMSRDDPLRIVATFLWLQCSSTCSTGLVNTTKWTYCADAVEVSCCLDANGHNDTRDTTDIRHNRHMTHNRHTTHNETRGDTAEVRNTADCPVVSCRARFKLGFLR